MNFGTSNADHTPGTGQPITLEYREKPGLVGLSLKNFVLNLITLSIYRFWAKTAVRKHVWSSVYVNGEPVEYTGTGKELFFGALVVLLILILPIIGIMLALQLLYGPEHVFVSAAQFLFILIGLLLWGMAIYRARRYRLSRTLWRGIRGSLSGSSSSFSLLYFGSMFLRGLTLGWSTPAMNLIIQKRLIGEMAFGDRPFRFSGSAGPLYARYAFCWFATPLVLILAGIAAFLVFGLDLAGLQELSESMKQSEAEDAGLGIVLTIIGLVVTGIAAYGVLWTFYTAREMALFADYTSFETATFNLNATPGSLIALWLGNMFILIVTLGIGQPFLLQRMVRYLCDRLAVEGAVNISAIQQSSTPLDRRGEGLLDAFDLDSFDAE